MNIPFKTAERGGDIRNQHHKDGYVPGTAWEPELLAAVYVNQLGPQPYGVSLPCFPGGSVLPVLRTVAVRILNILGALDGACRRNWEHIRQFGPSLYY